MKRTSPILATVRYGRSAPQFAVPIAVETALGSSMTVVPVRAPTAIRMAAIATLILVPISLWAHHAFAAEFDATKPVKLRGVVTKMDWINPHAWIHIDVKSADGKIVKWDIEAAAPNSMLRRGFNQDSL